MQWREDGQVLLVGYVQSVIEIESDSFVYRFWPAVELLYEIVPRHISIMSSRNSWSILGARRGSSKLRPACECLHLRHLRREREGRGVKRRLGDGAYSSLLLNMHVYQIRAGARYINTRYYLLKHILVSFTEPFSVPFFDK